MNITRTDSWQSGQRVFMPHNARAPSRRGKARRAEECQESPTLLEECSQQTNPRPVCAFRQDLGCLWTVSVALTDEQFSWWRVVLW